MKSKINNVPFFRPSIGEREISAVVECLSSGWLTTGPKALEFESQFATMMGPDIHAIAVNSATAAMHIGLEALGLEAGDEVILPTLTFTATAEVVRYFGAKPIFVDIDPATLCMDIAATRNAINANTKIIMPVHFGGRPCDMTELRLLANAYGLKILADAAHALPAYHQGSIIGNCTADITTFSFYANKTMTTGEGGMLVTKDTKVANRAKIMRLHGIDRDVFNRFSDIKAPWVYDVVAPGYKYNMTDIAAALGIIQLSRLREFHERRQNLVAKYFDALNDLPLILPPKAASGDVHSWHLFPLQLKADSIVARNEFILKLNARGVGTSVHYRPLHQMTYWAHATSSTFRHADSYFNSCLSIPLFMSMNDEEQDYVIQQVREVFG